MFSSYPNRCILILMLTALLTLAARAEPASPARPLYAAQIAAAPDHITVEQGGFATVTLTLANQGQLAWDSRLPQPIHVSWHLRAANGPMLALDNVRTPFLEPVAPGQTVTLTIRLDGQRFPPGAYLIEFDLVHEGQTWFAAQGSPTLTLPVTVIPLQETVVDAAALANPPTSALQVPDYPEFGQLWRLIDQTLAYTRQEIAIGQHRYQGFAAGNVYPQLWARDNATALHGSRWFYPAPTLHRWIELLLAHQQPDGSIPDWVDPRNQTDKNTVATDQETSLVSAASHYYRLSGDTAWLQTPIRGQTLLTRLSRALDYLWRHRRDPASGLLIGAHTIDWGDVELGECTQDAIYAGPDSQWTIDLYDQAMFVLAARPLAELYEAVGQPGIAQTWRTRAVALTAWTRARLWQPERGYFRMHQHLLSPHTHPFDEDALFPMGGNAVAIQAGIADPAMAERIVATARQRQAEYGLSTLSGVLLPPYPDDYYCHPLVSPAWSYQNGGQWDWFGARLMLAMYEAGDSNAATAALRQIAQQNVVSLAISEWRDRADQPRGSSWYSGSAGVLSRALVEGYFGIDSRGDALILQPRLKNVAGRIALREPATGRRIAYDYQPGPDRLELTLYTNHPAPPTLILTLPDGWPASSTVTVNGQPVASTDGRTGRDRWLRLQLPASADPAHIVVQPAG